MYYVKYVTPGNMPKKKTFNTEHARTRFIESIKKNNGRITAFGEDKPKPLTKKVEECETITEVSAVLLDEIIKLQNEVEKLKREISTFKCR